MVKYQVIITDAKSIDLFSKITAFCLNLNHQIIFTMQKYCLTIHAEFSLIFNLSSGLS